jgi:hypothetical protein
MPPICRFWSGHGDDDGRSSGAAAIVFCDDFH